MGKLAKFEERLGETWKRPQENLNRYNDRI